MHKIALVCKLSFVSILIPEFSFIHDIIRLVPFRPHCSHCLHSVSTNVSDTCSHAFLLVVTSNCVSRFRVITFREPGGLIKRSLETLRQASFRSAYIENMITYESTFTLSKFRTWKFENWNLFREYLFRTLTILNLVSLIIYSLFFFKQFKYTWKSCNNNNGKLREFFISSLYIFFFLMWKIPS